MLPQAKLQKVNGNVGSVKPSTSGVLAIIAASSLGTVNTPATFTRQTDAAGARGVGPLVDFAAYYMAVAGKPVLLITPTCTTAGTYGAVTKTGTGTSTITAGGTAPNDDYAVIVQFINGGTEGAAGITYRYSLDGGNNWSATISLGTSATVGPLVVPVLNISSGVEFTIGSGTVVTGDSFVCYTARPQMTTGDLTAALAALYNSKAPWDNLLIDVDATSTFVGAVDTWITNLDNRGKSVFAWMNTRKKLMPVPTAESESTFFTAMSTIVASTSTINIDVGSDGGFLASSVTGLVLARPCSLAIATRKNQYGLGVDPAFVQNGPIPGFTIDDINGNPLFHDEAIFPGLDDLRLSTFRTIDGEDGVYITNANILSAPGSSYVYDQHATVMNAACNAAYGRLTQELSKGVQLQPPDPTSNAQYILETDAQSIEDVVNPPTEASVAGQCQATAFVLSRTDNLAANGNGPATVTGELEVEYFKYIKTINAQAVPVSSITETITVAA